MLAIGEGRILGCFRCAMPTLAMSGLPKDPSVLRTVVREGKQDLGLYAAIAQGVRSGWAIRSTCSERRLARAQFSAAPDTTWQNDGVALCRVSLLSASQPLAAER